MAKTINARVRTIKDEVRTNKVTGKNYSMVTVELLDEDLKGMLVSAKRTLTNAEGVEKEPLQEGQSVILYTSTVKDDTAPGGFVAYFEISTGTNQADLNAALAKMGFGV